MTDPQPPIDTSDIDSPFPDLGHEALRLTFMAAIQQVWANHQALVAQYDDLAAKHDALAARVAALEPATAPAPPT